MVFYKEFDVEPDSFTDPATGQKLTDGTDDGKRRFARASRVFNADQVEGYEPDPLPHTSPLERMEAAEKFIQATKSRDPLWRRTSFFPAFIRSHPDAR